MGIEQPKSGSFTLHMLDAAQGNPVQSWHFKECSRVSIGRAAENDIGIVDTQVSRLHVELLFRNGKWVLISHGRNGTQINGDRIDECQLRDRVVFQLGSSGPSFQYVTFNDPVVGMHTLDEIDCNALDFLVIDEDQKAEEIEQITETDTFRELREQVERMKNERKADLSE